MKKILFILSIVFQNLLEFFIKWIRFHKVVNKFILWNGHYDDMSDSDSWLEASVCAIVKFLLKKKNFLLRVLIINVTVRI
jgi:hypothetical protein